MTTNKKAFINNYEAVSCAGLNAEQLFASICEKKDCITIDNTYVQDREVAIGKIKSDKTFNELLLETVLKVLKSSTLNNFENTLLIVGSSVGGMNETERVFFKDSSYENIDYRKHPIDAIAYLLKKEFSFYDDISFSTACTSSANALGYAKEVISKGIYKNVLVVGVDALSYTTVCGFSALSVLSSKPCTPFEKNREGMNVAEAIAVLLIQDEKVASSSVEICGVGYSSDAHHMTQPHPEGHGAAKAMQNAINDAKIEKEKILYINAHGTGTMANDSSELNAISLLFDTSKPYVSSTKAFTGHTLGAAGAIEAIISTMALQKQIIPPSKDIKAVEREDVLFSNEALNKEFSYVLSNSFAFGGNNTSILLGLDDDN
ncbi:beta-ketoacyl-[acyl-carrier-protein] synthase family protein [Halarcobacter bivalviorum]|uniref:Beta-ketoacyl synthase n=1 Tax=Halarcobacter bivalviorum TaxID=663364 RepID=A0AAX2AA11_9BACT|nr:beta-ketoacyl-[acyl-carrier-protein] synthase family protein [Halarcobacter bivalviorum]AXH11262.1 beta-ketoacyl-[acp] synthase [Halarcobacter bivalviorum]RXK09531.1 beta-ketoacyl synthase [Halarcobacter bivalviorum]